MLYPGSVWGTTPRATQDTDYSAVGVPSTVCPLVLMHKKPHNPHLANALLFI